MGWPSVAWGLAQISSAELTEWMAFIELEGLPELNQEFRSAKALHAFVNANRDPKRHRSEIPLKEFLPNYLQDGTPKPAINGEEPAAAPVDPRAQMAAEAKMKALQGAFS